jgi:hypothetical protein
VIVLARTAPSQLIGRARMLFCREEMYAGGSRDMAVVWRSLTKGADVYWYGGEGEVRGAIPRWI